MPLLYCSKTIAMTWVALLLFHSHEVFGLQFNLNEIYSLKVSPQIENKNTIQSVSNRFYEASGAVQPGYIIAPKHFRRYIDRMTKSKCHKLEDARIKHRQIDNEIITLLQHSYNTL